MDISNFTIGKATLARHSVTCYYPINGVDHKVGPGTCLSDLVHISTGSALSDCPIPSDQYNALKDRYADTKIWELVPQPAAVSNDLYPQIQQLLDGSNAALATRWRLTQQAKRFIQSANLYDEAVKAKYRNKKALELQVSASSVRRIGHHGVLSDRLRLKIDSVELITFSTGLGFIAARVSFSRKKAPLTAVELVEAVYSLSRNKFLIWYEQKSGETCSNGFSLQKLLNKLTLHDDDAPTENRRIPTLTYAQLLEGSSYQCRQHLGVLLARHYTSDYRVQIPSNRYELIADFNNVLHAVSLEGSSIIVGTALDAQGLPSYLENFETNAVIPVYSNVALLALHERAFLLAKALISGTKNDQDPDEAQLRQLTQSSLMFRLCFRHSHISEITMHNTVNTAYREVYGLNQMQQELHDDVAAIEAMMRETREMEYENHSRNLYRKFYWVGGLGSSVLGGLSGYTVVKEITRITHSTDPSVPATAGELPYDGPLSLVAGALVTGVALAITYLRRPTKSSVAASDSLSKTVLIQTMLRTARR